MKKILTKRNIIIISIFLLLFILILIIAKLSFNFELKGKNVVTINYNETYNEEGYELSIFNNDKSKDVKVSNNIKEGKTGNYSVKYEVKLGLFKFTKTRVVKIIDNIEPILELTGEENIKICPDGNYNEEGYKAYDEYDGDLTSNVVITKNNDNILYSVKDNGGNIVEKTRNITYVDEEKPKITLKGNKTIYLSLNSSYQEPGYTVSDNCSNNLENEVEITNNIDSSKNGSYTVTYKVKDKMNNESIVTRKIYVYDSSSYTSSNVGGIIYLTFDDGPSGSGSTTKILDILKKEGIKATFFVTGSGPDSLIKRAYDEGHSIALHTYTHDFSNIYSSTENYFKDLEKVKNRVFKLTGYESYIIRFPGGTNNTVSKKYQKGIMTDILAQTKEKGFKVYDWNVDGNDAGVCAKSSVSDKKTCVYNNVVNNLSKSRSNYVLMHDVKSYTAEALQDIINYGKNNGYIFDKITMDTPSYTFKPSN